MQGIIRCDSEKKYLLHGGCLVILLPSNMNPLPPFSCLVLQCGGRRVDFLLMEAVLASLKQWRQSTKLETETEIDTDTESEVDMCRLQLLRLCEACKVT